MNYPWLEKPFEQIKKMQDNSHLPHAILITGSKNIGKQVFAKEVIKYVLGEKNAKLVDKDFPNEKGDKDLLIRHSNYQNLIYCHRELNKQNKLSQEIRIDQIRKFCEILEKSADELQIGLLYYADEMTINAANSLLKTLEEPRKNTLIILLAHSKEKVPITIRSRCQSIHIPQTFDKKSQMWLEQQITNANDFNIGQLLRQSYGVPLTVKKWFETDELHKHSIWQQKWLDIALNPSEVRDLSMFKDNELLAIEYLQHLLIEEIKLYHQQQESGLKELNQIFAKANIKHIFKFINDIAKIIALFETQANKDLLFNSVVIIWSHITHLTTYPKLFGE
ncbi:DNA polymerase III delta prime subunit [hydrothermal vent metagenome]|uniref:DNA polymerase III delta prime subunit n=1 Tax=hydrothermal vent metagenome TaxID=652676 RepID=A0A1W1CPT3_9ZZZZ